MPRASTLYTIPTVAIRRWVALCDVHTVFTEEEMSQDFDPNLVAELVGIYGPDQVVGINGFAFLRMTMEGLAGNTAFDLPAAYWNMRETATDAEQVSALKHAIILLLDQIDNLWQRPAIDWVVLGRMNWQTGSKAHANRMNAKSVVIQTDENGDQIVVDEADIADPIAVRMRESKKLTINVEM